MIVNKVRNIVCPKVTNIFHCLIFILKCIKKWLYLIHTIHYFT